MAFVVRNNTATEVLLDGLGMFISASQEIDLQIYFELDEISRSVNETNPGSLGALESANIISFLNSLGGTVIPPEETSQVISLTETEREALDSVVTPLTSTNPPTSENQLTTGLAGKASVIHVHDHDDITDFDSEVTAIADSRISVKKAQANGLASLGSDGKVPNSQIPALAITDTYVVSSQAAMLALSSAGTGDIAIRTDDSKSYVLKGTDYSNINDWEELLSPGGGITSINGDSGPSVTLDTDDIGEGITNKYFTDSRVAGNSAVVANTAKISANGSVDTHSDVDTSTVSPSSGDILEWDGNNWVPKQPSSGVFGSQHHEEESWQLSCTTSTSWQEKLEMITSSLPSGKYRIGWSFLWGTSKDRRNGEFRIQLNNNNTVWQMYGRISKNGNNAEQSESGFVYVDLSAGALEIDLDFRRQENWTTVKISDARIELWRIS